MRNHLIFGNAIALISASGMLLCSRLGDSTDLGGNVINDVTPDKVTTSKHFRHYAMDSSAVVESFSLPGASDTGFGVHEVTGSNLVESNLVLGTKDGQRAAGYVQFACSPDTGESSRFDSTDRLQWVAVRFVRDTVVPACQIAVWRSDKRSHALSPSAGAGDSLLDTIVFKGADTSKKSNIPDSVTLKPGGLADVIFKACTTSNKAAANAMKTTFGFILDNIGSEGLVRLAGKPYLSIIYKHGSDTALKSVSYFSIGTAWYCATDGNSDTLHKKPWMIYSSKRTALFRYNVKKLWELAGKDPKRAQIIAAVFSLNSPAVNDTLTLQCLLRHSVVRDGVLLDSLFSKDTASHPVGIDLTGAAAKDVQVIRALSKYEQGTRDSTLYLYVRFREDPKQAWKQALLKGAPLLRATIAIQ